MKMKCRYIVLFLLVFSMAFGSTNTLKVQAAKTKLSKKSITMYTDEVIQLKVNNAKSKVKWSSSDKKIVRLMDKRGKYQQKVTLKSTDKPGKCNITAKIKGKTYICKVTVKEDTGIANVTVESVQKVDGYPWPGKLTGWTKNVYGTLVVNVCYNNYTSKKIMLPDDYDKVEKLIDGEWIDVTSHVSRDILGCGHAVLPGTELPYTYYVYFKEEDAANYQSGTYRLVMDYGSDDFPYCASSKEKVKFETIPFTLE